VKLPRGFLTFLVLFSLIGGRGWGQDYSKEYAREELSIQVRHFLVGVWSKEFSIGAVGQFDEWQFYQGFNKIKEYQFLSLAGYEDEAKKAKAFKTGTDFLLGTSITLLAGAFSCLGVGIYGAITSRDFTLPVLYASMGVDVAALIPSLILLVRGEKWMPLEKAVNIRDEYNEQLKRKLAQ